MMGPEQPGPFLIAIPARISLPPSSVIKCLPLPNTDVRHPTRTFAALRQTPSNCPSRQLANSNELRDSPSARNSTPNCRCSNAAVAILKLMNCLARTLGVSSVASPPARCLASDEDVWRIATNSIQLPFKAVGELHDELPHAAVRNSTGN